MIQFAGRHPRKTLGTWPRYELQGAAASRPELALTLDLALAAETHDDRALAAWESAVAQATGRNSAICFGSGWDALAALLGASGLPRGAQVIVSALAGPALSTTLQCSGLRPTPVDVDPLTFNLLPDAVAAAIGPDTAALLVCHAFGVGADMDALLALARRHGLLLLEDVSASLGARHQGRPHGSLGAAAFLSSDRSSLLGAHPGGLAVCDDQDLARRLRAERDRRSPPSRSSTRRLLLSCLEEALLDHPLIHRAGHGLLALLDRLGCHVALDDAPAGSAADGSQAPGPASAPARLLAAVLQRHQASLQHRRVLAHVVDGHVGHYGEALRGRFDEQAWQRASFLVRDRQAFSWLVRGAFPQPEPLQLPRAAAGWQTGGPFAVAERVVRQLVHLPTHPQVPLAAILSVFERHGAALDGLLLHAGD